MTIMRHSWAPQKWYTHWQLSDMKRSSLLAYTNIHFFPFWNAPFVKTIRLKKKAKELSCHVMSCHTGKDASENKRDCTGIDWQKISAYVNSFFFYIRYFQLFAFTSNAICMFLYLPLSFLLWQRPLGVSFLSMVLCRFHYLSPSISNRCFLLLSKSSSTWVVLGVSLSF